MALVRNRTLSDGGSTACFEVVGTGAEGPTPVVVAANLSGAGSDDNQGVIVKRVVATVASTAVGGGGLVTLSWGDGTDFLHLPPGFTDIDIPFEHHTAGGGDGDVDITASADTSFTVRIFVNKVTGFPLSMGHARNRP